MKNTYVLKVVSKNGETGYITNSKTFDIIIGGVDSRVLLFNSFDKAERTLKKLNKKAKKSEMTVSIVNVSELVKDKDLKGIVSMDKNVDMYYIENEKQHKVFYDEKNGYFFGNGDVGYCVWKDDDNLKTFITLLKESGFDVKAVKMENK